MNPGQSLRLREIDRLCDDFESSWKGGSRPQLADFLQRIPAEARPEAFGELLAIEVGYRRALGELPSPGDYEDTFGDFATIIQTELELRREEAAGVRPATGEEAAIAPAPAPEIPGFQFLRELGNGGMGVVWLAVQPELGREVAVKLLRSDLASDPEARARFRHEAEAAAALRHPNITQIFQVGQHDGKPFCVLEYATAGSLRDFLQTHRLDHRAAASLMVTLARAIAHAHEAGIVHRDLKPANILLTENAASPGCVPAQRGGAAARTASEESSTLGGRVPKIADFGLARRLDRIESVHTLAGTILGTPNYMPPEQAAGQSSLVEPRADVYSLGAIFHELLSGQPPCAGKDFVEILQKIRAGAIDPRNLASAPRDLATICLKSLALEPARRYPSAAALADDLERWLGDQPIEARRAGLLERGRLWFRRERKTATLALVATALLLTSLTVLTLVWRGGSQTARNHFQAELAELDQELQFIEREEFSLAPQMDQVRRQFLEKLGAKCEKLLDESGDHPFLQRQFVQVHLQLGLINEVLGRYAAAETSVQSAVALARSMAEGPRSLPGDWSRLARAQLQSASLCERIGKSGEAAESLEQAIAACDRESGSEETRPLRGEAHQKLGALQFRQGNIRTGLEHLQLALDLLGDFAAGQPDANSRRALSEAQTALAACLTSQGQLPRATELLDSAIETLSALEASESAPAHRLILARALATRGRSFEYLGRDRESAADLVRCYAVFRQLADDYPFRPDYRVEASFALQNVARHADSIPGEPAAFNPAAVDLAREMHPLEKRYRDALALQESLALELPELVDNQKRLAVTMNSLATWLYDKSTYLNDPELAKKAFDESYSLHQRSARIWNSLSERFPDSVEYRTDLARCHQRFGIVLNAAGEEELAAAQYLESIQTHEALARANPESLVHPVLLSALYNNLGTVADRNGDLAEAERLFRLAVQNARSVHERIDGYTTIRILLSTQISNLADVLIRRGEYGEAADLLPQTTAVYPVDWPFYKPVLELCRTAVETAGSDPGLDETQREAIVRRLETGTLGQVETLIETATSQFDQIPGYLASESALDHVRHRSEFTELLRKAAEKFTPDR